MAEYPSLPLWTDALLADTSHLNNSEFGLYLRLLILMWRTTGCRVPHDLEWIGKRVAYASASEISAIINEFCDTDGNWVWQKRLRKEHLYVKERSRAQSENAKVRWNKEKSDAVASAILSATTPPRNLDSLDTVPRNQLNSNDKKDATYTYTYNKERIDPNGSIPKKAAKLISMAEYVPTAEDEAYAIAQGCEPTRIALDIRTWAANAPHVKVMKKDPHAFYQGWCRREADRQSPRQRREQANREVQSVFDRLNDAVASRSECGGAGDAAALPASGTHLNGGANEALVESVLAEHHRRKQRSG